MDLLTQYKDCIGFGVATGRVFESAMTVLRANGIIKPDIIISSVGSQITYGDSLLHDKGWETHISKNWKRDVITSRLQDVDYLQLQGKAGQGSYKLSYNMAPGKERLPKIHHILTQQRCHYNLIYSHEKYLDILPYRASKGKAIRYLSYKWSIPLKNFLICGDSGNDEEMLKGEPLGIVVGNYSPELEKMKSLRNIYFAKKTFAAGMIEGINYYRFIAKAKKG